VSDLLTVFIDSNILFSTCYRSPNLFERLWRISGIRIVSAPYCVNEVRRNLVSPDQLHRFDQWLLRTEVVEDCPENQLPENLMLPAKDLPVLAAAARYKADILVTGDSNHFGNTVLGVQIESPGMFRKRYPEIFRD